MNLLLALLLALPLSLGLGLAGCKKKEKAPGAGGSAASAPAGDLKMTADAFYKDYNSLKGFAVIKKYGRKKVIISGAVLRTFDFGPAGGFQVWLATSSKAHISAKFSDKGAAAKKKKLKKGDPVVVKCKIGGMMGPHIHLIDCSLQ